MTKALQLSLILVVLFQVVFSIGPAIAAQDTDTFGKQVQTWDRQLERMANRVRSGRTGSLEERSLRVGLKNIVVAAAQERDAALTQASQIKGLIESLGPPPGENEKPEAEAIQKRRSALGKELALLEGQAKQADLIIARSDQVMAEIGKKSRARLKATLTERSVTPLSFKAWVIAAPEAVSLFQGSFIKAPATWWGGLSKNTEDQALFLRNLFIALVAAVVGWALGRWLRFQYGRVKGIDEPSHFRRLLAGLAEGGGRSLGPTLFILMLGALILEGGYLDEPGTVVVRALEKNLVIFFLGYALINAALTPQRLQWRLFNFGDEASHILVFRLKITLIAFLLFEGIRQAFAWATPSEELASVWSLLSTLTIVPLMISLLGSRIWGEVTAEGTDGTIKAVSKIARFRVFVTLALVTLPVIAALGFSGLAFYVMRAVVLSGLIIGSLLLLRDVGKEALIATFDNHRFLGRSFKNLFLLDQKSTTRVLFWLNILMNLLLVVVAAFLLLPAWGLSVEETASSASKILRGFKVGSYTLSFVDILIGFSLFVTIIIITRAIQKGLETHILPNLTQDKGVRDALKTGVGYIGVVIASLIAVSVAGLDLTNLALIAGALSVGLGFGLQNVVNNFVSGLILLAERPIKPGDWVVIGGHEGKVKKVNVRSTEIETFQRASVIIPNADLIATPVINWTHKNMMGRVEIPIGVAYGTDPSLVRSILLECASAHSNVLSKPEPFVLFRNFGDSSLDFELRAYISNVEGYLSTASDIRYAINDAFKENGIEIPFPQRTLHFASPPPVGGVPKEGEGELPEKDQGEA